MPRISDRPGNPYHDQQMQDYPDNVLRFALLSWVAAELAGGLDPFWRLKSSTPMTGRRGPPLAYLAARGNPPGQCLRCTTLPIGACSGPAYGGDRFTVVILPDAWGGV